MYIERGNITMRKKSAMRKKIAALLAGAMVLGVTACGSGETPAGSTETAATQEETAATQAETEAATEAESTDDQITLRMAWWGSQTRHDITVEVIEMYEKENPNVNIEYEFYDFDSYFTKLKTLVASDQVWDVFQLGGNFPEYMFKEAGVPLPTDNWTWEEFEDAAIKIHEKTGNFGSSGFTSSEFIAGCSTYIGQQGSKPGDYGFFNLNLDGMGFDDPQMLTPYIEMRALRISCTDTNSGVYP